MHIMGRMDGPSVPFVRSFEDPRFEASIENWDKRTVSLSHVEIIICFCLFFVSL